MARGRSVVPPCCKRYGSPLYCANWVPVDRVIAFLSKQEATAEEEKEKDEGVEKESAPIVDGWVVVLGGGGGEGRSGVRNVLLLARFDPATGSLSDQPTFRLETEGDLPYRMAVHPGGDGIVCSFPKSCRSFEFSKNEDGDDLALRPLEKPLIQLEDVGLQLALAFSPDGSMLAAGGEDGHLRVFKWSSMEPLIDQNDAHPSVKDLDFSSDGKFLVSLGTSGPCRVWDMTLNKAVASLPRENGENFGYCRFSQRSDHSLILYTTAMQGQHGKLVSWDPLSGKRVGSKKIVRDPICAFTVSPDGKLLAVPSSIPMDPSMKLYDDDTAEVDKRRYREMVGKLLYITITRPDIAFAVSRTSNLQLNSWLMIPDIHYYSRWGTIEGDIVMLNSNLEILTRVKKAHLGIVTSLVFKDSRALVSTSFDSSARVSIIEEKKKSGFGIWVFIVIILAILAYYLKSRAGI